MKLSFWNVALHYDRAVALRDVTLNLQPGRIVAVLGINGAGKSSFLRSASGVVFPDKGSITYDGSPLRRDDLALRRRMFFLPDVPALFPNESLIRNLSVILRLYEADGPNAEKLATETLAELSILELARDHVGTFSRGQIYKTALAALRVANPELWLLDEPFAAGMDFIGTAAFRRYARTAANAGATVVYSAQMLETVEGFADEVVMLKHGRLFAHEPVANLGKIVSEIGGREFGE